MLVDSLSDLSSLSLASNYIACVRGISLVDESHHVPLLSKAGVFSLPRTASASTLALTAVTLGRRAVIELRLDRFASRREALVLGRLEHVFVILLFLLSLLGVVCWPG